MTADCIFCKIARGELQSELLYEDEDIIVFKDINPRAKVHLLLVPREHIPSLNRLEEKHSSLLGKMFLIAQKMAEKEGIKESGYRLVVNCGPDSGQEVNHLHFHLLGGENLGLFVS